MGRLKGLGKTRMHLNFFNTEQGSSALMTCLDCHDLQRRRLKSSFRRFVPSSPSVLIPPPVPQSRGPSRWTSRAPFDYTQLRPCTRYLNSFVNFTLSFNIGLVRQASGHVFIGNQVAPPSSGPHVCRTGPLWPKLLHSSLSPSTHVTRIQVRHRDWEWSEANLRIGFPIVPKHYFSLRSIR